MALRQSVDVDAALELRGERPSADPSVAIDAAVPRTRVPGFDVARALAVLGMVLVDLRHEVLGYDGPTWLLWLFDALEGKAAALFVLLAGVGLSLRTQGSEEAGIVDRRPLFERAFFLIVIGLLLLHVWEYDILHFHGVYLLLAIPLLGARTGVLWLLAAGAVLVAAVLYRELDWALRPTLSPGGALRHVFFNGLYPVFPWIAFVLVGMAVGRLGLHEAPVRRRVIAVSLAIAVGCAAIDSIGRWELQSGAHGLGSGATWLLTWPRAPRPFFVASGCAIAVALVAICIAVTQSRAQHRWVLALTATGQLTITLYVAHVVAILVPVQHGLLRGWPIEAAFTLAIAFYGAAIAFALWWRRRWRMGPLEGLLRQVIARDRPTPAAMLKDR